MKKATMIALVVILVLSAVPVTVLAEEPVEYTYDTPKDSHKVRNKWDLSGSFVGLSGYHWGSLGGGLTWTYNIHIKEAMDGQYSVGSLHFIADGVDVVGRVKATSRTTYWGELGAVGTTVYNETTYYFMFLYNHHAMWFALSETPYDVYWPAGIWPWSLRAYQLHSPVYDDQFPVDPHVIHE